MLHPISHSVYHQWIPAGRVQGLQSHADEEHGKTIASLVRTLEWVHAFIMKPHDGLGRSGAVCPFVAPALEEEKVYFCVSGNRGADERSLTEELLQEGVRFMNALKQEERKSPLLSLLLLFPEMEEDNFPVFCAAKQAVKASFLERGMTLGEFYPGNRDGSVHNAGFRVADAPVPMVVIRAMAAHDQLFLHSQPELYKWYLEKYPAR